MDLRRRLTISAVVAVGIAVVAACVAAYSAVRGELYDQVDDALRASTLRLPFAGEGAPPPPLLPRFRQPGPREGGPPAYLQLVRPDGTVARLRGDLELPVDAAVRRVTAQGGTDGPRSVRVHGVHVRELTVGLGGFGAVQVARPLDQTDRVLRRLRWVLLAVVAGGIGLAAALGRRVARSFSSVLHDLEDSNAELDASLRAQRQLVADASHELRTPVTSLRTNVEVLLEGGELDGASRAHLLDDVREQTEELSALVGDLIDLARGDAQHVERQDVRLDALVEEAVARARRHAPGVVFEIRAEPVSLDGVPERLGRAVNNLLDNAARHSPEGGTVEVSVTRAGVAVRDHGPGFDEGDLPQVFDRFYRGEAARGVQGSGLGLAIVRQVAQAHGGDARARNAPGGGAELVLELPGRAVEQPDRTAVH